MIKRILKDHDTQRYDSKYSLANFEYNLLQKIREFLHDCHRLAAG